jgi:hypothetical protein
VIEFFVAEGQNLSCIHECSLKTCGEATMDVSSVYDA